MPLRSPTVRSLIATALKVRPLGGLSRVSLRATGLLLLFASVGASTGCERLKAAVGRGEAAQQYIADPVWHGDSSLMANSPSLLFRIIDHKKGRVAVPFAVLDNGLRRLRMGERGWKALDLNYLQEGRTLEALHDGRVGGTVKLTQGYWTTAGQLDTLAFGDACKVPAGLVDAPPGVEFAVTGRPPKPLPSATLSEAELASAISKVPTLILPSFGVPRSMLGRYQREVHVLNTGVYEKPSIMVIYNDPEIVSDTVTATGQRPRQVIIILDKGVYGYRPSYDYTTLGNRDSRMTYLDHFDTDNDGKAEIFFGVKIKQLNGEVFDGIIVIRPEGESWRRFMGEVVRCTVSIPLRMNN